MIKMLCCIAMVNCFAFPTLAYAYLDPGTGSIILQGMLAAFVAGGMYFRSLRHYIKSFFVRDKQKDDEGKDGDQRGVDKS